MGTADFIFYFLPIVISVLHHNPNFPLIMAAISTALSLIGFLRSPEGMDTELAFLNRAFAIITALIISVLVRRIIIAKNELDKNNWLKNGGAELLNNSRGELNPQEISKAILSLMASLLKMDAGTIYLLNDRKDGLQLLSAWAAPNELPIFIKLGEGYLGQCAESRKLIHCSPAPKDYFPLRGTLGSGNPDHLIFLPLITDKELIGVIELVFSTEHNPLTIQFLEQYAESIAITLRSSLFKSKLAELLHQSQQQTEELKAQQEELRVTNDELEQQSKAVQDSHTHLQNLQAELEVNNQQLEEQTQILSVQKKDLLETRAHLEEKVKEIEKSSQYKSEFLANMSHELRTPLNSSLILAKLLMENRPGNLTPEQIKYADIIYHSGNDLLNLINDILDISKVEAGKMVIHPEKTSLPQLLSSLKEAFTPIAQQKNLDFHLRTASETSQFIFTDRMRLEQILRNLLSNAFKFTEKGTVTLELSQNKNMLSFSVQDTGIGIPDNQQKSIFEAFRQADGTTARKHGGTGLGLSISKELTRLLGGEITIKSIPGKGSTFTLILPLEHTQDKELIQTPPDEEKLVDVKKSPREVLPHASNFSFNDDREKINQYSKKILIIEDDENFSKILYNISHEMHYGALVASTADEGLYLARTFLPHAILLDVRLPDHSGLMVLDQLKGNAKTRHIPVHVMSAEDYSRSAMEMGAMGYMMKPVKKERLLEAFEGLTAMLEQKLKHVLVVEDDVVQREHISELIADPGVKVDSVATSKEALEMLSKNTYDCMIMDLSLPDLSGHELLAKLSENESIYSYPPVIVYTARDLDQEEEDKLRAYSGSIIIKGAKSPERLISEVTLFLHKVETELPPDRQKMLKDLRSREKTLEDRVILIVDDDVRNIFALTSALEGFGAKIEVARNGREALLKVEELPLLDLILMDIMMPEMDGYEAMKAIRSNKKYEALPIIALTAKAMLDDKQKCLQAGANDYLPKPIHMDKLLSLIRVWLPFKRSFLH